MKTILLVALLLAAVPLFSQNKGASPLPDPSAVSRPPSAVTRAVVIGISDYREPLIPDLKFADRDAEAFASWLRSTAGMGLPDSNLVFLKNKGATTAQMIVSLDWLIEKSAPGDRAFIYFSGHGDVERVTKFQRGYLLSHDSPPAVYGAGAFSLNYLQDILSTLSEKNVQAFVITDACRAGKLAGSSVGGAQATATQLSQQFANEIKVLSCQPDEFSLEGEQWGGGRGCFSYHLEDALYGFADGNGDATVDLLELRRYLEDNVSREAAPQNQLPMVAGPVKTVVAAVRPDAVAARKAEKGNRATPFRAVDNRGMEDRLLEKMDTSDQRIYAQFLAAVDSGFLMKPAGRSADDYFKMLLERPAMAALHGAMKRKLAAALMDEGQTIINKVLRTDPQVLDNIFANRVKYDHLPAYFERATEILGERHYAWRDLKAKEFYFRAMTFRLENYPDSSAEWRSTERRKWLGKSLERDSSSAVVFYELGKTYEGHSKERIGYYKKAASLARGWALIYHELGLNTSAMESISNYKKAIELDSTFLQPCYSMTWVLDDLGQRDSASFWRQKYLAAFFQRFKIDPASLRSVECEYAGLMLWREGEFEKAKAFLLRGEELSGGKADLIYGSLVVVYTDLLDFENAKKACEKRGWSYNLGDINFYFQNDTANAVAAWAKADGVAEYEQIHAWMAMGKADRAFYLAKKNLESSSMAFYLIAESARQLGMADTATHYFGRVLEKSTPEISGSWSKTYPDYLIAALAFSRLGKKGELDKLLQSANEKLHGDPFHLFALASFYAQTDQPKAAIASLQKAIEMGWKPDPLIWIYGTLCDPLLHPIRETADFKKLVKKHFPKYYDIATRVPGRR